MPRVCRWVALLSTAQTTSILLELLPADPIADTKLLRMQVMGLLCGLPTQPVSFGTVQGLAVGSCRTIILTGQTAYAFSGILSYYWTTFDLGSNGVPVWTNHFPQPAFGSSGANSVALDSGNSCYVTGFSPGTNSGNDIVTIKYDNNGNQIWLQRYNGPGNGDDEGNAIAVDANGNVYVAGYETTAAGGTEMVVIKYAPGPFLKKEANGNFMLQAVGAAGENFDFQASTNLVDWQDLGTNTADSNGLVQFVDTNAPLFPWRFYLTTPQQ